MKTYATTQALNLWVWVLAISLAAANLAQAVDAEPEGILIRLEELNMAHMVQGFGVPMVKQSIDKNPLTIGGVQFEHGVGTHAISRFTIDLKGVALAFRAKVGLDDEATSKNGSICFRVYVDKKKVYDSGVLKGFNPPRDVNVNLMGAKRLDLIVSDAGDFIDYDHADWADAVLILRKDATEKPESVARQTPPEEILTPKPSPAPRINAPSKIGAGTNRDFLYYVPVAGQRPMTITVEGLPPGLEFNPQSGIIRGTTGDKGDFPLQISAENEAGKDAKKVVLCVGSRLALSPPMGWNSWNCWGCSVDDAKVRSSAAAMVKSGLINHGWTYINIDDCWQGKRDPQTGEITTNEKFPEMKALADSLHAQGLKFGIYTDAGTKTCAGYEGTKGNELLDPKTYARWGVDYVKIDWCYTEGMEPKSAYGLFGKGLAECGRDIVYSICNWGYKNPWEWGKEVGGNCWRTTGDIVDTWGSVYLIAEKNAPLDSYAGPGHWNDPDMLVVGQVGWGPKLHKTRLTPVHQYSHISLWCLFASPLLLGCDLSQLDEFTLSLLTNDEVLAVNQDALGKQARRVFKDEKLQVYVKDLEDGSKAVGILNTAAKELDENESDTITVTWSSLGLEGPQRVRDLWRQKDLGVFPKSYTITLPEYGSQLLKVVSVTAPTK